MGLLDALVQLSSQIGLVNLDTSTTYNVLGDGNQITGQNVQWLVIAVAVLGCVGIVVAGR